MTDAEEAFQKLAEVITDMRWIASLQPDARRHAEQRLRNGMQALRKHEDTEVALSTEERVTWIAEMRQRVRASIERDFPTAATAT